MDWLEKDISIKDYTLVHENKIEIFNLRYALLSSKGILERQLIKYDLPETEKEEIKKNLQEITKALNQ